VKASIEGVPVPAGGGHLMVDEEYEDDPEEKEQ